MASFIEILKLEMQSTAFQEILDQELPHRTTDEQQAIMQEVLEMAEQNEEISDNSTSIEYGMNLQNQQDSHDTGKLALKYLKQFVNHIANMRNMLGHNQHMIEEPVNHLLSTDANQSEEVDGMNFWLSAMRPEDEFMLEEESSALENSSDDDELEEQCQSAPRITIEDVWMKIVQSARSTSKSAGAA